MYGQVDFRVFVIKSIDNVDICDEGEYRRCTECASGDEVHSEAPIRLHFQRKARRERDRKCERPLVHSHPWGREISRRQFRRSRSRFRASQTDRGGRGCARLLRRASADRQELRGFLGGRRGPTEYAPALVNAYYFAALRAKFTAREQGSQLNTRHCERSEASAPRNDGQGEASRMDSVCAVAGNRLENARVRGKNCSVVGFRSGGHVRAPIELVFGDYDAHDDP